MDLSDFSNDQLCDLREAAYAVADANAKFRAVFDSLNDQACSREQRTVPAATFSQLNDVDEIMSDLDRVRHLGSLLSQL